MAGCQLIQGGRRICGGPSFLPKVCLMQLRVVLMAALLALGPATVARAEGEGVQYFSQTDPAMQAAISAARKHLPEFLKKAAQADLSAGGYLVKWARPLDQGGNEHIWVAVAEIGADQMIGFLTDQPVDFAGAAGDQVTVPTTEISDWAYWDEAGMMHGSYTTRVMLGQMTAEDRAQFEAILAPLPKEN